MESVKNSGLEGFLIYFQLKMGIVKNISLSELAYPVHLRPNTSDSSTFKQIFIRREYDIQVGFKPKVIFDIGANIGLAAIYFSNRFSEAKIISIEPASDNFEMMMKNIAPYKNINALHSAIWNEDKNLKVVDKGLGAWGYTVEEATLEDSDYFSAFSIKSIMEKFNVDKIDILKMDIEGSEKIVFSQNYEYWLPRIRVLVVDILDWINPGCSDMVLNALSTYNSLEKGGRKSYFINQDS